MIVLPRTLRQKTANLGNSSAAGVGHCEKAKGADSLYIGNGLTTRIGNCRRGTGGTSLAPVGKEPGEVRVWPMPIDPPVVRAIARRLLDDSGASSRQSWSSVKSLIRRARIERAKGLACSSMLPPREPIGITAPTRHYLYYVSYNPQGDFYLSAADSSEILSGDIV